MTSHAYNVRGVYIGVIIMQIGLHASGNASFGFGSKQNKTKIVVGIYEKFCSWDLPHTIFVWTFFFLLNGIS